jgi:hypothetical protein
MRDVARGEGRCRSMRLPVGVVSVLALLLLLGGCSSSTVVGTSTSTTTTSSVVAPQPHMTLSPTRGEPGTLVHITVTACPPPNRANADRASVWVHDPWSEAPGAPKPSLTLRRHQVGGSVEVSYRIRDTASSKGKALFLVYCGATLGSDATAVFTVS